MSEIINKGLKDIPDDLILSYRKSDDKALDNLITEYNKISAKNSNMLDITEEHTGKDLKNALEKVSYPIRVNLVCRYMHDANIIESDLDYIKEVKLLKLKVFRYGALVVGGLFIFITTGVVTVGLSRNQIDSNGFLNGLMNFISELVLWWLRQ